MASPSVQTTTKITAKGTTNNKTKNKEYGRKDEDKKGGLLEEEGISLYTIPYVLSDTILITLYKYGELVI